MSSSIDGRNASVDRVIYWNIDALLALYRSRSFLNLRVRGDW